MAKECYYCGFKDPMPFTCKFCGKSFCYNHRLPESHNCTGLALLKERVHEGGISYPYPKEPVSRRTRENVPGKLMTALSVIKSNYSLTILVIAIVSFFLQGIPGYFTYFALSPSDMIYQPLKFAINLITHIFLHGSPMHIIFNMMFLFFFGPELERRIGGKKFLIVFFLSGIIAAIGYSSWSIFVLNSTTPAVGASGALFGIFACLAILAPYIQVYIFFIPMKITHALVLFAVVDLLFLGGTTSGLITQDIVARSAHLSGAVAGLVMGKKIKESGRYQR